MNLQEFMDRLLQDRGVVRVERMPDELFDMVYAEDSNIKTAGGMRFVNKGMEQSKDRKVRICFFTSRDYVAARSMTDHSLVMKDPSGEIIGHDIPITEAPKYMEMPNVIFISDNFIVYTDKKITGDPIMEMPGRPYRGESGWIPEEMHAVVWAPVATSSVMINTFYQERNDDLASNIMGLDIEE